MILNPKIVIEVGYLKTSSFTKVQQNGIDVSLEEELTLNSLESKNILLNESINLWGNVCGELKIRSTYSRKGVFLSSGFWDTGFKGKLGCTLYNMSKETIIIPAGERVCQFICYEADPASFYNGQYQGN